jgi:hypothetical protein
MFLKSHKWTDVPGSRYERRYCDSIRETYHSAVIFERKYYDCESGKFIRDKMEKIGSCSLGDAIDVEVGSHHSTNTVYRQHSMEREEASPVYNFPKFIPKDDDFDDEMIANKKRIENEIKKERSHQAYLNEQKMKEIEARKISQQIERELIEAREARLAMDKVKIWGNVRPNNWTPK